MFSVKVQHEDFNAGKEYQALKSVGAGAIVTFCGLVRDHSAEGRIDALTLEHYPGMTENTLQQLLEHAGRRWSLLAGRIIHRVGRLEAHQQIVFVGIASEHRQAAFEAASFVMDRLKNDVPLWKKQHGQQGEHWVEVKESDRQAGAKW